MRKEPTFINFIVLLHVVVYGGLLVFAATDYWAFVDWFALPSVTSSLYLDNTNTGYIVFLVLVDTIKGGILDLMIAAGGYDLLRTLMIIMVVIALAAVADYFLQPGIFPLVSVAAGAAVLLIAVAAGPVVGKADVDRAFRNWSYEDATGADYLALLREQGFAEVDEALKQFEADFLQGTYTDQQYEYEYDKFGKADESELELMNEWVAMSKYPEAALTARGAALYRLGWKARGENTADKTSDEQFERMRSFFNRAREDFIRAIDLDPRRLYAYGSLVAMEGAHGSDELAEAYYQRGRRLFPGSYYLAFGRIDKLQEKWGGSDVEMRRVAMEGRENAQRNPMLIALTGVELVSTGSQYWSADDYRAAAALYRQALLYGARRSLFVSLHHIHKQNDDLDKAADTMTLCLEHHPQSSRCRLYRSVIYAKTHEWKRAREDVEAAQELGLGKGWQYHHAAWVYETIGKDKLAGRLYMQASDIDPDDTKALERIYVLSFYQHISYDEAAPYMKRWTRIRPNDPDVWLKYADTIEDYEPARALPLYRKYLELVDHDADENGKSIDYVNAQVKRITALVKTRSRNDGTEERR